MIDFICEWNRSTWVLIFVMLISVFFYIDMMYNLTGNDMPLFSAIRKIDRYFGIMIPSTRIFLIDIIFWCILVYGIYVVNTGDMDISYKIGSTILMMITPVVLVFPLLNVFNQIVWLFCTNPPMNLDKNKYFPKHGEFENPHAFRKIKKEVESVLKLDELRCINQYQATDLDNNDTKKCWKWFPILDQRGWHKKNVAHLPFIVSLIKQNKQIVSASISIIEPGMGIPAHKGYIQSIFRYHLGVIIPTDKRPYIVCGNQKYFWKEGEGVLFDDMYLHHVVNPSKYRRAILWLDIIRNDLPYPLNNVMEYSREIIDSMNFLKTYDIANHVQKNLKQKNNGTSENVSESEQTNYPEAESRSD